MSNKVSQLTNTYKNGIFGIRAVKHEFILRSEHSHQKPVPMTVYAIIFMESIDPPTGKPWELALGHLARVEWNGIDISGLVMNSAVNIYMDIHRELIDENDQCAWCYNHEDLAEEIKFQPVEKRYKLTHSENVAGRQYETEIDCVQLDALTEDGGHVQGLWEVVQAWINKVPVFANDLFSEEVQNEVYQYACDIRESQEHGYPPASIGRFSSHLDPHSPQAPRTGITLPKSVSKAA